MSGKHIELQAPELQVIEKSKAEQIRTTFKPMVKMLANFEDAYNEVMKEAEVEITDLVTGKAKRLRLDISRIRITTEAIRKEQKEEYLRAGKAIDGVSNILKWAVIDKENKLKEIEDHFKIQERAMLVALQEARVEKLSPYVEDAENMLLSTMDNDVWDIFFNAKKKDHDDLIKANKKAEQDRIAKEKAEAKEQERIRLENVELKKEAIEKERLDKIEADKRGKEDLARAEKQREEKEVYDNKLAVEKARQDKLRAELKAREDADREKKEAEEARVQAEMNKGDAQKVQDLKNDLVILKVKYQFRSVKNKRMYSDVGLLLDKIINHIQGEK